MADFAASLSLEDLREEYKRGALDEVNCDPNPMEQFRRWIQEARAAQLKEPNAMTLSTATPDGRPSGRMMLLKEVSELGFVFYTNYLSRKGREVETNPFVALTFYWAELARQVRVEGRARRLSREQSAVYFQTRPKGSRLSAWASRQSEPLPSRAPLETRLRDLQQQYGANDEIPLPEYWGGYCVSPRLIEFWQGRPNRMHDRLVYRRKGEETWFMERLSP